MPSDRGTVREIAWSEVFPWVSLFSTLRLAIHYRALILAALGLVVMTGGWKVCGLPFGLEFKDQPWPWTGMTPAFDAAQFPDAAAQSPERAILSGLTSHGPAEFGLRASWISGPLVQAWNSISAPAYQLFDAGNDYKRFAYLLLCSLWAFAVWGFFGAAITRLAAVRLARHQQLSWGQVFGFTLTKWPAFFAAPLFPMLGVLVASLPLMLIGLLLRTDVSAILAGALWIVVLAVGVLLTILLLGLFFGWPLMYATISAEGTDSFDALSRSYAYTYQRPLHYLFYVAVASVIGSLGYVFVQLFADTLVKLGFWAVSWGSSSDRLAEVLAAPSKLSDPGRAGASLIWFAIFCVATLKIAFIYSYFWTAMTGVYFLLRRNVDATEMDEVFLSEEEESFGLPSLATDAAAVADAPPASASGATADRPANDG